MTKIEQTPDFQTQEIATQAVTASPYIDLIKEIWQQEKLPAPQTPEEAIERFTAAQEAYESLEPPEVDLPDTPQRTLKELLYDRQQQYWLDRGEIRSGDMKAVDQFVPMLDTSPSNNALRLAMNLPREVPQDVFQWAIAKTVLAGRLWDELSGARMFDRQVGTQRNTGKGVIDTDIIADREYGHELVSVMQGMARIEIRGGKPTLVPNTFEDSSINLGAEIHRRHMSWQERHELMSRSSKLRVAGPLLADMLTARSTWALGDLAQFHYGEYYGYGQGAQAQATGQAVEQTATVEK